MNAHGQIRSSTILSFHKRIMLFAALILISGLVVAETANGTNGTTDEFIFKTNVHAGPCPGAVKVSICNDSLLPQNITALKEGWAKFGDNCDPVKHKQTWEFFWLHPDPEETINNFLAPTFMGPPKRKSCSEFVYQTCGDANKTCVCNRGAVFENGQCKLVEGAGVGSIQCGDNLIPKRVEDFTLITDPRSCLLDFEIECAGTAECMCHRIGNDTKPSQLYKASESPTSFCNPRLGTEVFKNAQKLANQTVKVAESLKWLSIGQRCLIHENFSSKFKTHVEIKILVMKWIEDFSREFFKICNPFKNMECDLKSKDCVCSQDFIFQNGECRLIATVEKHDHSHLSDRGRNGTGIFGHQACEWVPEFNFFIPHNFEDNNFSGEDFNFSALTARQVPCVENSTCEDEHGLKNKIKECKCNPGKVCQKMSQKNENGPSHIVNKNLQVLSLCSALVMHFLSANPF